MKRIPRFLLLTLFSLLVLGGTRSFAGPKPPPHSFIVKEEGFIQQLLNDIFGNPNPNPKTGSGNSGGWANGNSSGPTAPIDGGISLLLAVGIGLGAKRMAKRNANTSNG
jgi:hypothetical protein